MSNFQNLGFHKLFFLILFKTHKWNPKLFEVTESVWMKWYYGSIILGNWMHKFANMIIWDPDCDLMLNEFKSKQSHNKENESVGTIEEISEGDFFTEISKIFRTRVGDCEGGFEGATVGNMVGMTVGTSVGYMVGTSVGTAVGGGSVVRYTVNPK